MISQVCSAVKRCYAFIIRFEMYTILFLIDAAYYRLSFETKLLFDLPANNGFWRVISVLLSTVLETVLN